MISLHTAFQNTLRAFLAHISLCLSLIVPMRENADQKNYECGQFSRSGKVNIVFREKNWFLCKEVPQHSMKCCFNSSVSEYFFQNILSTERVSLLKKVKLFWVKMHQILLKVKKARKKWFFARPANLLKKRLHHRGFPKFFNTFLYNTFGCVFKYAVINWSTYIYKKNIETFLKFFM